MVFEQIVGETKICPESDVKLYWLIFLELVQP